MKGKKILMIAHQYPPAESVGGLRAYYFAKNLAKLGWRVSILTSRVRDRVPSQRNSLKGVDIYQSTDIFNLRRFACKWKLSVPDFEIGWILPAFRICDRIVENFVPQIVYATCNPFSSALIGALLKKKYGIPLILDFRDPWTIDWDMVYPTSLHKAVDNFLESSILKIVDHLIVVTENMKEEYVRKYTYLQSKISTITNGFDVSDFPTHALSSFEKFTITYCGSFSGPRRPDVFLHGLKEVVIRKKLSPWNLQVFFLGPNNEDLSRLVRILGLDQFVFHMGYLPHREALDFTFKSHLLLLVEPRPALTNKVFEYLATGKPILALVSRGELEELVKKYSDGSYVLTSPNSSEVAEAIYDCYNKWVHNRYHLTGVETVEAFKKIYDRKALTEKLIYILDQLITSKSQSITL